MNIDDIVNILFVVLIIGYSLFRILGSIFFPKEIPKRVEEDEAEAPPRAATHPLPPPLPAAIKVALPEKKFSTEKFEFHSKLEDFQQVSEIESQKLTIHLRPSDELVSESLRMLGSEGTVYKRKSKNSISRLIKSLPQEKLLFLSYEVFHVPVSKRETPFPWNN